MTMAEARRLAYFLVGGVLLAIVTGPEGRVGDPTYSVSGAMQPGHLFTCVGIGLAAWVLVVAGGPAISRVRDATVEPRARLREASQRRANRRGFTLALLAAAIAVPPFLSSYWQGALVEQIGIYALLAVGLNVVVGFAGLLDLGYIAFYAIGAYTAAYFTGTLPVHPPITLDPFYAIPLATITAMIAGLILGAPTLRLRGDYLAIVTLGFGEIVTILAINLDSFTNGSRGAFGIPSFAVHIGSLNYDWGLSNLPYYYLLLGFAVIIVILFSLLENSRVGRAWTAIREDEVAAQAVGIPTVRYKLMAFMIGASTSGFAGVLYASKIGYINPSSFSVSLSILALVLVIFGGMGSLPGAIIGAATIQWFFAYVREHNGAPIPLTGVTIPIDPADIFIYVGAVLIIMMIFRPQGIVPSRRRAREIGLAERGVGAADAMSAPPGSAPT